MSVSAHASALQISSKPIAAAWEPIHFCCVSGWEGARAVGFCYWDSAFWKAAQSDFVFCFFKQRGFEYKNRLFICYCQLLETHECCYYIIIIKILLASVDDRA